MKIASLAVSFALFAVAACGPKTTTAVDKPGPTTPPPATIDIAKLGSACGADGTCPDGTACAKYYGIAGPRGPEFTSCEVACDAGQVCPDGTACITIADGPGAVCRPTETTPPVAE